MSNIKLLLDCWTSGFYTEVSGDLKLKSKRFFAGCNMTDDTGNPVLSFYLFPQGGKTQA
jgi:hypothetical protein